VEVAGVLETCLYATDLEAAERFYTQVLRLKPLSRADGRHVFFRCGGAMFLVFNPAHTSRVPTFVVGSAVPFHGASGSGHVAFAVLDEELGAWRDWLSGRGVTIEAEIRWPEGGRSLYFRDPAGNSVELATREVWGIDGCRP
jgi:catechol 2,3-dioxygenase-like lactoylglutathione lyase family enzyme